MSLRDKEFVSYVKLLFFFKERLYRDDESSKFYFNNALSSITKNALVFPKISYQISKRQPSILDTLMASFLPFL